MKTGGGNHNGRLVVLLPPKLDQNPGGGKKKKQGKGNEATPGRKQDCEKKFKKNGWKTENLQDSGRGGGKNKFTKHCKNAKSGPSGVGKEKKRG